MRLDDPSFHDDSIYGLRLVSAEPERDDWRSELVLDIDHILEWQKQDDGRFRFVVVQADLCFENVSDLKVSFACPGFSLNPLPILAIERSDKLSKNPNSALEDYEWTIRLADRADGRLTFRASGFRLDQVGTPGEYDEQTIPQHLRR